MLSLSVLVLMEQGLWQGLEVWEISISVKNKSNSGNHEVDENDDNTLPIIHLLIVCKGGINHRLG